jgi:hypothetical protein
VTQRPRTRSAPALTTVVQDLVQIAIRSGLVPLLGDVEDDGTFTISLLPHDQADPEHDAEWLLVVNAEHQDGDLTLLGPPPAERPSDDAWEWSGGTVIATVLKQVQRH